MEDLFLRSMILISLGRYSDSAMRHDCWWAVGQLGWGGVDTKLSLQVVRERIEAT